MGSISVVVLELNKARTAGALWKRSVPTCPWTWLTQRSLKAGMTGDMTFQVQHTAGRRQAFCSVSAGVNPHLVMEVIAEVPELDGFSAEGWSNKTNLLMIFHFVSIGFIGSHNKIHPAHAMLHCHCDRGCGNAWKSGEWPDLCSITWCRKQPARTVSCLTKWKVLHKCLWGREATRSWQWAEPAHFLEATFFAAKSAHSIVEGNTVGCWSLQKGRCCAHECVLRLEVLRGWKATGSWS